MPYQNYTVRVYENLRELYQASGERWGEKTLFYEKKGGRYHRFSYGEYREDVDALGTELYHKGLAGKKILLAGRNCYEWVVVYLSIACLGTVVPTDREISAEELENIVKIAGIETVVCDEIVSKKVTEGGIGVNVIPFDSLEKLIKKGKKRIEDGETDYLERPIDRDSMCALLFTSGTTGDAKGVMLSHHNLCFNISEMCRMFYVDEKDLFLSILPLHHAYECTCGFLAPLSRGSEIAFSEGLRHVMENMREVRPTVMLCVPLFLETMYRKIWANLKQNRLDTKVKTAIGMTNSIPSERLRPLSKKKLFADIHKNFGGRLRALISGGAPADPQVMRGLRELGIPTYQGYGLTECAPLVAINRDTFYRDKSAGLATPNALLDIYDAQNDGIGEIRYQGENVMLGYYGQPEATAEVIRDGWLYTGDLGYMDEDGFLYVTGRKKNVIVTSGGKNVFPEELEYHLNKNPFIKESVVVGCFNPKRREYDIVAVLRPDYERMEATYGIDYSNDKLRLEMKKAVTEVNGRVLPYKRIFTFLIRREEFPKTSSQKILREGIIREANRSYLTKSEG